MGLEKVQARNATGILWLLLVLTSVFWLLYKVPPEWIYSSDNIYPYSLYIDLLRDHNSLREWNIPNSPCFFPDLTLYGIVWLITDQLRPGAVLFGCMNLLLDAWLMQLIVKRLLLPSHPQKNVIGLMPGALFLSLGAAGAFIVALYHYTFIGHFGVVQITMLLCLLLLGDFPKISLKSKALSMVLIILGSVSDRLILVNFVAPFFATMAIVAVVSKKYRKGAIHAFVTCGAGTLLGSYAFNRLCQKLDIQRIDKIVNFKDLNKMVQSKNLFVRSLLDEATIPASMILFALGALGFAVLFSRLLKKSDRQVDEDARPKITALFLLLSISAGILAPIVTGLFVSAECWRYCLNVFPFCLLGLSFILAHSWIRQKKALLQSICTFALALILFFGWNALKNNTSQNTLTYRPKLTECLDNLYERKEIRGGLAFYWNAKFSRFLSNNEIEVLQLNPPFEPFHWGDSKVWYPLNEEQAKKQPLNFVITDQLDPKAITAKLGAPEKKFNCDGKEVWVYQNQEALTRLNRFFIGKI